MQIDKNNLLLNIFEKENGIPENYEFLHFSNNDLIFKSENIQDTPPSTNDVNYVSHVPDYIKTKLKAESQFHLKKFYQQKGYAVDLSNFQDIDTYLKNQFRSNAKTIRRYVRRLESCFDIRYKLFYGAISQEEYGFILSILRKMIVNRFQQRNEQSKNLLQWNRTVEITYPLLLKKRASIFVIYDKDKPIEISINYHFNQILFSYISSYDIDYAKFGLGHIEIYKQLEWCLDNDINRFEMGWGDLDYKRRWSNHIYNFEQQLSYHKNSLIAKMKCNIMALKIRFKLFLISKNVHIHVRNLKKRLKSNTPTNDRANYEIIPIENFSLESGFTKIDHLQDTYSFLQKIINDYLYGAIEHISNIEVFEGIKNKSYLIKGSRKAQKIVFLE